MSHSEQISAVRVSFEARRGCGYRKGGGLYLVSDAIGEPCSALPVALSVCPTCHSGVKPTRGWTWVAPKALLDLPRGPHAPEAHYVSTVGELWFERRSREIHAEVHDPKWLAENKHRMGDDFDHAYMIRFGFETLGLDRTYETMVFRAGKPCDAKDCGCGLPKIDGSEVDADGYNDAAAATRGHYAMCEKWAREP